MTFKKYILALLFFTVTASTFADEPKQQPAQTYVHQGLVYPPVLYVSNIEDDSFKRKLESYNAFSRLDEEQLGLPIGVRVLKGLRSKGDGAQFSTLMFSAATLGILPVVSNQTFKVRYDVFVQGNSVSHYEYEMTSTDVSSMWSGLRESDNLKPAEQLFLEDSINKFYSDLQKDEKVQKFFEEYRLYFGK